MMNCLTHVSCSSARIVSSDHVLVKVNISLTIVRKLPEHHQESGSSLKLTGRDYKLSCQEWSFISISPEINNAWESFHTSLLSLMYRFIAPCLQLAYLSSCPWCTESCGEAVAFKQLAFSSWKANLTEGNLR